MLDTLRKLSFAVAIATLLAACGADQASPPQTLALTSKKSSSQASYEPLVQGLFAGYFGRPADPAGLAFFAANYAGAGAPLTLRGLSEQYLASPQLRALVDSFASSQESQDLYPGNDAAFLTRIYQQMFNREPDAPGLAFWTNAIGQGHVTRSSAVLSIMAGAVGSDLALMEKKALVARLFTASLATAQQREAYSGMDVNQLAREMLSSVTVDTDPAAFQRSIDVVIASVVALRSNYVEVAALDRTIALIVGADQDTNAGRISALAQVLASDLNARASALGARYSVRVLAAAASAIAVREQVKGHAGAILIGNVPVPTQVDQSNGDIVPAMDPLRVPYCAEQVFEGPPDRVRFNPYPHYHVPACRNGITISVLRGRASLTQAADVARKLDQMIWYHAASDVANQAWSRRYDFIGALWNGGYEWEDPAPYWAGVPLFDAAQIAYTMQGSAAQRKAAFVNCLGRDQEACGLNGHGGWQGVQFEGTGVPGTFYSSDVENLFTDSFAAYPSNAKFVTLASCSTHNFLPENSFATSLLMSGRTLLSLGSTTVAMIAGEFEPLQTTRNMSHLQLGATFAEAFAYSMEATPMNFQGDPYISMRPVPQGSLPKMVINGKHYNEGTGSVALEVPDSVGGLPSYGTAAIRNAGAADLKLRLTMMPYGLAIDGQRPNFNGYSGLGFELDSPYTAETGSVADLGLDFVTVRPGESVDVRYSLSPILGNGVTTVYGVYTARLEILSNDPASFHTFIEMRGTVR